MRPTLFKSYSFELINISCLPSSTDLNAIVSVEQDLSPVMPYLNATVRRGHYSRSDHIFDFMLRRHIITISAYEMKVTGVRDRDHAAALIEEIRQIINETWERSETISPRFEHVRPAGALELFRALPRTNCGECGLPTCLAFATLIVSEPEHLSRCPALGEPEYAERRSKILALLDIE